MPNFLAFRRKAWVIYFNVVWYFRNPQHQWSSVSQYAADKFCEEALEKYKEVTEATLISLDNRVKEINKSLWPLFITNNVIFFVLLLSTFGINVKVSIQGLNLDMSSQLKEVLFFISTTLSLVEAAKLIPAEILYRCLNTALDKSKLPQFERYKYQNSVDMISELLLPSRGEHGSLAYVLSLLVALLFSIIYFFLYPALFLAAYVYIGIDIHSHPAFPGAISNFILVYGSVTVIFAFTVRLVFTHVPFRFKHPKIVRQFEKIGVRKDRNKLLRDLGRREARGNGLFLRLALNRKKLLTGLVGLEKLALWNKFARRQLREDRRRKKRETFL